LETPWGTGQDGRSAGSRTEESVAIPTSRIEVDLSKIEHNVGVIRRLLARGREDQRVPGLCAVLKADGYGLGSARVARKLAALGVEMIAVYTPDQARTLVEAAITVPILVLMPVRDLERNDPLYRAASRGRLHLAIHDTANLQAVAEIADRQGLTLPVHVEVDTGMSRGGVAPADAKVLLEKIDKHARLRLAGVFTHFASADVDDAQTRAQHERFAHWLDDVKALIPHDCIIHQANTFAMFRGSTLHRDMVRVGLALLGYGSEEFVGSFELQRDAEQLRGCMRWMSTITHLKTIEAGTPVGYGATWTAKRKTRVALVPVGYADGYPLAASNKATVRIETPEGEWLSAPMIGRVSMDQVTVDVTDLPGDLVAIGTNVEVVGSTPGEGNYLPTLAREAGTITHELLCRLSHRVARVYTNGESTTTGAVMLDADARADAVKR